MTNQMHLAVLCNAHHAFHYIEYFFNCLPIATHQSIIERENAHIPAVMDVIPAHDRIGVVLHPDTSERVPADLVILVRSLSVIRHVQSDILTIRYITMSDHRIRADATNTDSGTDCKKSRVQKIIIRIKF